MQTEHRASKGYIIAVVGAQLQADHENRSVPVLYLRDNQHGSLTFTPEMDLSGVPFDHKLLYEACAAIFEHERAILEHVTKTLEGKEHIECAIAAKILANYRARIRKQYTQSKERLEINQKLERLYRTESDHRYPDE